MLDQNFYVFVLCFIYLKNYLSHPLDLPNLCIAVEMFAKYAITTGFSLMFAYTAELYPTPLRNTATGIMSTAARFGCCITPFFLNMSE